MEKCLSSGVRVEQMAAWKNTQLEQENPERGVREPVQTLSLKKCVPVKDCKKLWENTRALSLSHMQR